MIFVFGSNAGGLHAGGAALFAYKNQGARWGFSYGHMGNSFAIPTKGLVRTPNGNGDFTHHIGETLSLEHIQAYITGFLAYAVSHPELEFKVTRIGCGLAGLEDKDIAPMFVGAPINCQFDTAWMPYLGCHKYWGTV